MIENSKLGGDLKHFLWAQKSFLTYERPAVFICLDWPTKAYLHRQIKDTYLEAITTATEVSLYRACKKY